MLHRVSHFIYSCKLSHELGSLHHIHLCFFSWFVNWRPPCRIRIHRHFVSPLKVSTCVLPSTCKVGSERILYWSWHPCTVTAYHPQILCTQGSHDHTCIVDSCGYSLQRRRRDTLSNLSSECKVYQRRGWWLEGLEDRVHILSNSSWKWFVMSTVTVTL